MLKEMAWNTFKNSGNIDTFMELIRVKNIEKDLRAESNGNSKDKGNNNNGK